MSSQKHGAQRGILDGEGVIYYAVPGRARPSADVNVWMAAALTSGIWLTKAEALARAQTPPLAEGAAPFVPLGPSGRRPRIEFDPGARPPGKLRLRLPLIERMEQNGDLERQHVDAAEEIRAIVQAWEQGVSVGALDLARAGGSRGGPVELASMSALAMQAYRSSFIPWVERCRGSLVADGAGRPVDGRAALNLTMTAALSGPSLRHLEKRFRLRNGRAKGVIRIILGWWPVFGDTRLAPRG